MTLCETERVGVVSPHRHGRDSHVTAEVANVTLVPSGHWSSHVSYGGTHVMALTKGPQPGRSRNDHVLPDSRHPDAVAAVADGRVARRTSARGELCGTGM